MRLLNNLRIGTRLMLVFLIIVVVTTFGFLYLRSKSLVIKEQIDSIYKIHLFSIDYLLQADRDAYQSSLSISQSLTSYAKSSDETEKKLNSAIKENVDQVLERYTLFEKLSVAINVGDNIAKNKSFHDSYKKVKDYTGQIIQFLEEGEIKKAEEIYFGPYQPEFDKMRGVMDVFTQASEDEASKAYKLSVELSENIMLNSLIIIIFVIFFIIIAAFLLTRSITRPIFIAVRLLDKFANGNLNIKVPKQYRRRKDEIGKLLSSLSAMLKNMNNIVQTIKQNAEQIASASLQLNDTSQIMSQGASEQASSVEEVSSTMEEISANITQNSDNAKQTEKISEASAQGMQRMAETAKESLDSINTISQKITIINDIAFQTNILALNAAVEAARAGAHGKGFAVVASEVRKLAERSQTAAEEIIGLSEKSVKITEIASELLNSILPEVSKTARLVEEISAASEEQSNGASQVNNALMQLSQVTQQNAASSEELASSATQMASQAETLNELVSFFKIGGDADNIKLKKKNKVNKKNHQKEHEKLILMKSKIQQKQKDKPKQQQNIKEEETAKAKDSALDLLDNEEDVDFTKY